MNDEIFEENNIDTFSENIDSSDMDNSVSETEAITEVGEIDTVESILSLLEERLKEEREESEDEENEEGEVLSAADEVGAESSEPVLVSVENETDYTDMILEIHHKLDAIENNQQEIIVSVKPLGFDSALVDMPLDTLLLVAILIILVGSFIVRSIKSLVFKL